ncbi:GTPase Obg-like [Scylla paramamosain]|uniref:GTPase Obg-like n=1 Tax=Scylla paramamosain TaxID=85552 RepID=UPI003082EF8B
MDSYKYRICGEAGAELIIPVHTGTTVWLEQHQKLLGGQSSNPSNQYNGQKGQGHIVKLELKLLADVGLVGFPNAGKSALLWAISRARPKVASYPFTTLQPTLGVVEYSDMWWLTIADLPRLIEGAWANVGMGHRFLRHVERTHFLLFVVDINGFRLSPKHPYCSPTENVMLVNRLTCGVPQGTKMGPLCFLLLINDALTDTPYRWKYVDDCTVGVPVSTKNPDYSPLQAILERLQTWTEESRMTINHNKTVVMHFCTSSVPVPPPQLSVGPHPLQVVRCAKLLGVTVDDQLTWKQHVASTIRSATYRLYMLHRLRSLGTPTDELRGVYLTFILPKLMYASPAWSSSLTQTQQLQLESVQKRACRVILGPAYTTYEEALNTLKLSRLSTRYSEALKKFGRGLLNHPRLRSMLPPDAPRPTHATRHHNKITPLKVPRTDRYRLSAIPTMVRAINQ